MMKGKKRFQKGHPKSYDGIKLPVEKFRDVWDLYGTFQISQVKAAKMLGVSQPTFTKWRNQILANGDIDKRLTFLIWDD